MTKPWEKPERAKAMVTIDRDLYQRVKNNFHYGQLSQLFRNMFESLDEKIKNDEIIDVVNYIYKNQPLTLNPVKENNEASNDSDE